MKKFLIACNYYEFDVLVSNIACVTDTLEEANDLKEKFEEYKKKFLRYWSEYRNINNILYFHTIQHNESFLSFLKEKDPTNIKYHNIFLNLFSKHFFVQSYFDVEEVEYIKQ
jgi:hypothetical protein